MINEYDISISPLCFFFDNSDIVLYNSCALHVACIQNDRPIELRIQSVFLTWSLFGLGVIY